MSKIKRESLLALIVVEVRKTVKQLSMCTKRRCRLTVYVQNERYRTPIAFKTEIDLDRKVLATVYRNVWNEVSRYESFVISGTRHAVFQTFSLLV